MKTSNKIILVSIIIAVIFIVMAIDKKIVKENLQTMKNIKSILKLWFLMLF